MTRFYVMDPHAGKQIDVTKPISTGGLDLQPEITPETLIDLWDKDGNLIGTHPVKDLPVSVAQVRELLARRSP